MKKISEEIKKSAEPIIKVIRKNDGFKVMAIGLNKGVILKKHKAPENAKLLIIKGTVSYVSEREKVCLETFDEYNIPVGELHELIAIEASICLLIIG